MLRTLSVKDRPGIFRLLSIMGLGPRVARSYESASQRFLVAAVERSDNVAISAD